jgi:hypothetical protein
VTELVARPLVGEEEWGWLVVSRGGQVTRRMGVRWAEFDDPVARAAFCQEFLKRVDARRYEVAAERKT